MKLWEAIKALQEGKRIRNHQWDSTRYLYLENGVIWNQDNHSLDDSYGAPIKYLLSAPEDEWEVIPGWISFSPFSHNLDIATIICPYCRTGVNKVKEDKDYKYCPNCGRQVVK